MEAMTPLDEDAFLLLRTSVMFGAVAVRNRLPFGC